MIGKETKLYSVLRMKCPQCHEGDFFEGHPYNFSVMGKVKNKCSHCNKKFELETGFYHGSYYVSYSLGVALFVAVFVLNYIFMEKTNPTFLMISFVLSLILLVPLFYSLSKIIWANMFIKYDKKYSN